MPTEPSAVVPGPQAPGTVDPAATGPVDPAAPPGPGEFVTEDPNLIVDGEPVSNSPAGGFVPSEKVDLLFVIDNSSSMADKQEIFKQAIPDLIDQMVNPPCVVTETKEFVPFPPGEVACPAGSTRIFDPVTDIHIGLISSSLGPRGTEGEEVPFGCTDAPHENDKSWLLGRVRAEVGPESYENMGFLVWDANSKATPPGDSDLATLVGKFERQVEAVGETGCGYEAPLEAAYRFLVEPDPYESLQRAPCPSRPDAGNLCVEPAGVDNDLLAQRAAFLRPDSVVVVMFLTDENDCSLRASPQGYMAMVNRQLSNSTSACEADPNSECCLPCGAALPPSCDANPETNGCSVASADTNEARTLRCFDQKRRFGVSFLRETDVYVRGYINSQIPDRTGQPVQNPLFTPQRGREKIFVVGIVGVPWQDTATPETVAAADTGRLDLVEASAVDWGRFLPLNGAGPTDPFNTEGMTARTGAHPVTGDAVGGAGTWNAINGHDRALKTADGLEDDLQYSCIFPLTQPRDCSMGESFSCDCVVETNAEGTVFNYYEGNPLCYDQATATYGTTQHFAKAYPAPRMLEVLQGVSCPPDLAEGASCTDQSVVASICPRQVNDSTKQDYGYRPVIRALLLNVAKRIVR